MRQEHVLGYEKGILRSKESSKQHASLLWNGSKDQRQIGYVRVIPFHVGSAEGRLPLVWNKLPFARLATLDMLPRNFGIIFAKIAFIGVNDWIDYSRCMHGLKISELCGDYVETILDFVETMLRLSWTLSRLCQDYAMPWKLSSEFFICRRVNQLMRLAVPFARFMSPSICTNHRWIRNSLLYGQFGPGVESYSEKANCIACVGDSSAAATFTYSNAMGWRQATAQ